MSDLNTSNNTLPTHSDSLQTSEVPDQNALERLTQQYKIACQHLIKTGRLVRELTVGEITDAEEHILLLQKANEDHSTARQALDQLRELLPRDYRIEVLAELNA